MTSLLLLCFSSLLVLAAGSSAYTAVHVLNAESSAVMLPPRGRGRSLLSFSEHTELAFRGERRTELVARPDGTIVLRTKKSKRVIWSFASGSPIYSSYQAPPTSDNGLGNASQPASAFRIDLGEDWELYVHAGHSDKMKLNVPIEEFIKHAPYVSEDGAVTLGSKMTTVYVVDAMTGRQLHVYKLHDSPLMTESGKRATSLNDADNSNKELLDSDAINTAEQRFHITRTDYTLQSFYPNSGKISWSLMVAEIETFLLCQDTDAPFITSTLNSSNEFPENGSDFDFPFSCQSKGVVIREHDGFHNRTMLLDTAPKAKLLSLPEVDKLSNFSHSRDNKTTGPLPPMENNGSRIVDVHNRRTPRTLVQSIFTKYLLPLYFLFFVILVGFVICHHFPVAKVLTELKDLVVANLNGPSKRKKLRRSGKSNGSIEKKDKHVSSESEDGFSPIYRDSKMLLELNKLDGGIDGRQIGKLVVLTKEIAKGSNGTIVLEGFYEGRAVAVKRLVQAYHDVAFKEIQNLIASDRHPNIVRWYGVEYDQDFVYLALERCTCSVDDLIQICSNTSQNPVFSEAQTTRAVIEHKTGLNSVKGILQDLNLWKANGHPSPLLLKLMRDVVFGLAHLHDLGIIHRDLKPQNVLIIKEKTLYAKLSDMGISKRLLEDRSSLGHCATGCGSSGWQAPEQLLHGRQTRAIDLFSLGCVLYFCITRGRHPFGNHLERDINVVNNRMNLFLVEHIPEAVDLISRLLSPVPELRPNALEVLQHPLFWSSELRLSFLRDVSDRVELEDRDAYSQILYALESTAPVALGGNWNEKMEPAFIANIGYYRRYKFGSVRDLLRVMRNKLNHYRELPIEIQKLVGPVPEGFDGYFAGRFPRLLIEVYKVVSIHCREEECFQKYFKCDSV